MYVVKEKHFLDSVQYQIYEKHGQRDFSEKGLVDMPSMLLEVLQVFSKLTENPFNENNLELIEGLNDEREVDRARSIASSRARTIQKIYDYGRSNMWDWFFTLTFNPEKVDSFDYIACSKKLSTWLNNLRKKCPDMIYLVVPEQHASGRWHFHGLFANVDSLEFSETDFYAKGGQRIHNVGSYKWGFSTAIRLDGSPKVVSYMTKYITKDLCERTKGKKRYWVSRNANLPEVEEFVLNTSYEDIIEQIDLSDARIVTKDGYVKVTYIDKPTSIYSKNM